MENHNFKEMFLLETLDS